MLHLSTVATLLFLLEPTFGSIRQDYFRKASICDLDDRILHGCSRQVGSLKGGLDCQAVCSRNDVCIGASMDAQTRCYAHHECEEIASCVAVATDHVFMMKSCNNGGVRNPDTFQCQCVNGMSGKMCEIYPTKCEDLISLGYQKSDQKTTLDIYGDRSHLMPVVCRCFESWCQTACFSNGGEADFNKTWTEYRDGFYTDASHFWIGLDNLYRLYKLGLFATMATVVDFKDGSKTSRRHSGITLTNESGGYSMSYTDTVTIYTNRNGYNVGDCWDGIQNQAFSTWDNDQDGDVTTNCAANAGSGWWYTDCSPPCNVLGWAMHYATSKRASSIMKFKGIDMNVEKDNILKSSLYVW